jgi:WD40 repeat protein
MKYIILLIMTWIGLSLTAMNPQTKGSLRTKPVAQLATYLPPIELQHIVLDYLGWENIQTLEGHTAPVLSTTVSSDGALLISGSADKTVKVWHSKNDIFKLSQTLQNHTSEVTSVALSPNEKYIASGSSDNTINISKLKDGKYHSFQKLAHSGPVTSVSFSLDGQWIVSGSEDKTVKLWALLSGLYISDDKFGEPHKHIRFSGHDDTVNSVALSPAIDAWFCHHDRYGDREDNSKVNGLIKFVPNDSTRVHYIVSGSRDKTIKIWLFRDDSLLIPFGTSNLICVFKTEENIKSVTFSRDGKYMAAGSDHILQLWKFDNNQFNLIQTMHFPVDSINSIAFSQDGKFIVLGSSDKSVKIISLQDGKTPIQSAAVSQNGQYIAANINYDPLILEHQLWGHDGPVQSVSFFPDGNKVVSGSDDKTIKIWKNQVKEFENTEVTNTPQSDSCVIQ